MSIFSKSKQTNFTLKMEVVVPLSIFFLLMAACSTGVDVIKEVTRSVVQVLVYEEKDQKGQVISKGNGFFLNAKGDVMTSFCVFRNAVSAAIKTSEGKVYPVRKVIAEDKERRLVQVSVDIPSERVRPLALASSFPHFNEKVYVVPNPLMSREKTVKFSMIEDNMIMGKIMRITPAVPGELDGSPLINSKGEVIGILGTQLIQGEGIDFGILCIPKPGFTKVNGDLWLWILSKDLESTIDATHCFLEGHIYADLERWKQAVRYYEDAVYLRPNFSAFFCSLGGGYFKLKQYDKAIGALKQAINIDPDFAAAHCQLGYVYIELESYNKAAVALKQALKLDSNNAVAYAGLGAVLVALGDWDRGITALKRAIQIDPDFYDAHYILFMLYTKRGERLNSAEHLNEMRRIENKRKLLGKR